MHKTDYIKIAALILLPLSLIKKFDGVFTNFQIFYVILGVYSFFYFKLWNKKLIQAIIALFIINIVNSLYLNQRIQWLEYIQLGAMISLVWYLKEKLTEFEFLRYGKIVTILSVSTCVYNEFFTKNIYGYRAFFGIERVAGLVGEPNFSAFASLFPLLLFFRTKNYGWMLFSFIPIIWTQSRGIFLSIFLVIILMLIEKVRPQFTRLLRFPLLIIFVLSPIIVTIAFELSSDATKSQVIHSISTRFYLTRYYTEVGIRNPLGVGLANGHKEYVNNGKQFRKDIFKIIEQNSDKEKNKHTYVERAEQHSIFVQILNEFGILTLLFLVALCVRFRHFINSGSFLIIGCGTALTFMNGLNELTTYVFIAYELLLISQIRDEKIA